MLVYSFLPGGDLCIYHSHQLLFFGQVIVTYKHALCIDSGKSNKPWKTANLANCLKYVKLIAHLAVGKWAESGYCF